MAELSLRRKQRRDRFLKACSSSVECVVFPTHKISQSRSKKVHKRGEAGVFGVDVHLGCLPVFVAEIMHGQCHCR